MITVSIRISKRRKRLHVAQCAYSASDTLARQAYRFMERGVDELHVDWICSNIGNRALRS